MLKETATKESLKEFHDSFLHIPHILREMRQLKIKGEISNPADCIVTKFLQNKFDNIDAFFPVSGIRLKNNTYIKLDEMPMLPQISSMFDSQMLCDSFYGK